MNRRALTGLGIVSRLGVGKDFLDEGLRKKETPPYLPIESFDATKYATPHVYEVPSFDAKKYLGDKGLRSLDRLTKLMVVASRLALHDAGLKKDGEFVGLAGDRIGFCCSNAYGMLEAATELDRVAKLEDVRYINPAKFPNTVANSASGYVSIWEDLRAINVTVSDGNCGALDAVACADIYIDSARADVILVGGAEAMTEALYVAFQKLGVLDLGASIGEAAVFMAYESVDTAKKRGAKILAEVIGYGTSFVAPDDERLIFASGEAMVRAIRGALEDAKLTPNDVDLVASGISGLRDFDDTELRAIRTVLPDVAIAAPKQHFGDTLGASGAVGMAAAITWFAGTPPVLHLGAAPKKLKRVLVTTLGYYGNASALLLERSE